MPFAFVGRLPAAPSVLSRLLVAQSFNPQLKITGENAWEDGRDLRASLARMASPWQAGRSSANLQLLALRASRLPGRHRIECHPSVAVEPTENLRKTLRQLGVLCTVEANGLEIESSGWKMHGDTLLLPSARDHELASAVALNAWDLPFDVYVSFGGQRAAVGDWRMTVEILQQLGLRMDFWDADFRIPKGQHLKDEQTIFAEIDLGAAFALAAVAAISGRATFLEFPAVSVQPEFQFVTILKRMGVPLQIENSSLKVERAIRLAGIAVNLRSMQSSLPIVAALAALAEGESDLYGIDSELEFTADWVRAIGRQVDVKPDGLRIYGERRAHGPSALTFDCARDPNLAFAAGLLLRAGHLVQVLHAEAVKRRFPEFWSILGIPQ